MTKPSCEKCNGMCCRYVSTEIDEPEDMEEFQNIRWFLLHENVNVYIDEEDDWILEFITKCEKLGPDNKCTAYETRPDICKKHKVGKCDMFGDDKPYKVKFHNVEEFEDYMKKHYKQTTQKVFKKRD